MIRFILIIIALFQSLPAQADEWSVRPNSSQIAQIEKRSRNVDQAALHAQESAIKKLKDRVQKYANTPQEPFLLMRLAEVYKESAAIEFRVAHGKAHLQTQPHSTGVKLNSYYSIFKSQIQTLDRLIQKYPQYSAIDQCLFLRGKAHEELKLKQLAKEDYLSLVHKHPLSTHLIPAYMALAEMAIINNQHAEALTYLTEVEKKPDNPFYSFALYKSAWSYFNLKDIPHAVEHLEMQVAFYDRLFQNGKALSTSDLAIRETALLDLVSFYLEGNELKPDLYPLNSALHYIKEREQGELAGRLLGKMTLRVAKILRSHRRDAELMIWKTTLLKEESTRPETIDVVMTLFQHQMNQNLMEQAALTSQDIVTLFKGNHISIQGIEGQPKESQVKNSYKNAIKELMDQANLLQARFSSLSHSTPNAESTLVLSTLSKLYQVFIDIAPEQDPRVAQVHSNLAEALFKSGQYDEASKNYAWIISHWNSQSPFNRSEIQLKLISSRYESLRKTQWIPTDMAASSFDQGPLDETQTQAVLKKLPQMAYEWIQWISELEKNLKSDSLPKTVDSKTLYETMANFSFEANRAIYARLSSRVATQRLIQFALDHPQSKFSTPSIKLGIDTYIKSSDWDGTLKLSLQLLDKKWSNPSLPNPSFMDPAFTERLKLTAADATYKLAEAKFQAQDYAATLSHLQLLERRFPQTERMSDGLYLSAMSLLATQQNDKAQKVLAQLIQKYPESKSKGTALLKLAQLSESNYQLEMATQNYLAYWNSLKQGTDSQKASLKSKENQEILRRIQFLQWINSNSPVQCSSDNTAEESQLECERYQAMQILTQDSQLSLPASTIDRAFQAATKGAKENKAIWSAVSLKFDPDLQIRDQLTLIRNLCKGWEALDPLLKLVVLPTFNTLLPETFAKARANLKKEVPLNKASSQAITRRAEWIKEFENGALIAIQLPWTRIQSAVLYELSLVYSEFSQTLTSLPIPKEMAGQELQDYQSEVQKIAAPFLAKSKELSSKAYLIASSSSVEDETLIPIQGANSEKVNIDTKTIKNQLPSWSSATRISEINLTFLQFLTTKLTQPQEQKEYSLLRNLWVSAYEKRSWPKLAYFLKVLREKKLASPTELKVMQSLILVSSGAVAEGLVELEAASSEAEIPLKNLIRQTLFNRYAHTLSVEKATRIEKEIEKTKKETVSLKTGGKS